MKYWLRIAIPTMMILLILFCGMTMIQRQYISDYLLEETEQLVKEELSQNARVQADALSRYLSSQNVSPYAPKQVLHEYMEHYVAFQPYHEKGIYLRLYRVTRRYSINLFNTNLRNDYEQCYKEDPLQKSPITQTELESGEVKIIQNISDGTLACAMRKLPDYPDFVLVYYQTVNQRSWNLTLIVVQLFGVIAAILMGLSLFLIIRALIQPLDELALATREYARNDGGPRIDPVGWNEIAEMATLFNTLADETRRLEAAEEEAMRKQRFLDSFTHEMRTPLTNIYGYSELMKRVPLSEEDRLRYLDYMMHESSRMNRLSEELFNLTVLRENAAQMELMPCAMLLDTVQQSLEGKAQKKGIKFVCEKSDSKIYGSPALLESLCTNLAENAIRACGESDVVRLVFQDSGDGVVLRVVDTGMGIAPDQIKHITEPFYRVDKARSRAEGGVGLGLYLCSEIVRIHSAVMFIDSREGEGTTVTVRFPGEKNN